MSNRFHNKWHRRNHHTYTNPTNPDAGHDPIASQQQPFLGEFVLFGSLSTWAPLSSYAGGFFTNNTSICAIAGYRGMFVQAPRVGIEVKSNSLAVSAYSDILGISVNSPSMFGRAISATASFLGLDIWSNNIAISAQGNKIALEAQSINRAISAYGGYVAGEFMSPSRAISAYSPLIAGEFVSARTAISAQGSNVAIEAYSYNKAVSAYGGSIGFEVYSPTRAISAFGDKVGLEVYSPFRAISAFGNTVAVEAYSYNNAISAFSNILGAYIYGTLTGTYVEGMSAGAIFSSPMVSLSTGGGGYNVLNSRTGIYCIPMEKDVVGTPFTPVLAVNGNSYFDGGVTITGDLSTLGRMSYLDTKVVITSSLYIENKGTDAAATIIQSGNQPVLVCYDKDVSLGIPSFIVDGATNGNVGINTAPTQLTNGAKLSILADSNSLANALSAIGGVWVEGTISLNVSGNSNTFLNTTTNATTAIIGQDESTPTTTNINGYTRILGLTQINNFGSRNTNIGTTTAATTVTVGQDGATPTNVNINGNTTVLGTTNINATGSKNTNVGNASSTTTVTGPTNINNSGSSNTNIGTTTSTTTVTVGQNSGTPTIVGINGTTTISGSTNINNSVNSNTNINTGTSSGIASIGNINSTVTIAGATTINNNVNSETKINNGTSTSNVYIGGTSNQTLLYSPTVSAQNNLIVTNQLSARVVSQKTTINNPTANITVDLFDAAYQVYPINSTTNINYTNIVPGRTVFVLLSSIAPSVQTLNPDSSFIYLNGRPTTLAGSKVGLMEIYTFGYSTSGVVIKYTAQP